jgi:hypothetical protein
LVAFKHAVLKKLLGSSEIKVDDREKKGRGMKRDGDKMEVVAPNGTQVSMANGEIQCLLKSP